MKRFHLRFGKGMAGGFALAFAVASLVSGGAFAVYRAFRTLEAGIVLVREEARAAREEARSANDGILLALDEARVAREAGDRALRAFRADMNVRIGATGGGIERGIREMDARYAAILEEYRKRTIDDLYSSDELAGRRERGIRLYREGDFAGALTALSPVRSLVSDDSEALFCLIASEFLINPQDRERHTVIRRDLLDLRARGFNSEELDGIVGHIEAEARAHE